jgi:predicted metal-dependent hydrolase
VHPDLDDAHELAAGLTAYRAERYFEAHERWEDRWRSEDRPSHRLMLQALVQLAAALHKRTTGIRPRGAPALLRRAAAKLDRLAEAGERPFDLDPARLAEQVRSVEQGGPPPDIVRYP